MQNEFRVTFLCQGLKVTGVIQLCLSHWRCTFRMERPHGADAGDSCSTSSSVNILTSTEIQKRTHEIFGVRPCLWQVKVATAILHGDKDVICMAGTGMGKTLTFWIPLLFRPGGIQIVVTPLNLLGKQNTTSLAKAGIRAIPIYSGTATPANFRVSCTCYHTNVPLSHRS